MGQNNPPRLTTLGKLPGNCTYIYMYIMYVSGDSGLGTRYL